MMFEKRKTTLKLVEEVNDKKDFMFTKDITEMNTSDLVEVFVEMMTLQGYHPVAIWRALNDATYNLEELFESIEKSKDEWNEDNPAQQEMDV